MAWRRSLVSSELSDLDGAVAEVLAALDHLCLHLFRHTDDPASARLLGLLLGVQERIATWR